MPERLLALHGGAALRAHLDAPPPDPTLPAYVASYLVQVRLGIGVPFSYLVPDEALLPNESIRFFTVDEGWFDAATQGVLAVGTASTRDTEHVLAVIARVQAAVRDAVPLVARVRRRTATRAHVAAHVSAHLSAPAATVSDHQTSDAKTASDPATAVTGFLLRSALVSGWPGLSVRAFTTADIPDGTDPSTVPAEQCVPLLRLELVSPSILLVLFSGTPALVWLEEPHHGIQLGVDNAGGVSEVTPVNPDGTERVPAATPVEVPMRTGGLNVVDIAQLAAALDAGGPADLATQLLRPPWRERFASE
jgi:hypothetical protein